MYYVLYLQICGEPRETIFLTIIFSSGEHNHKELKFGSRVTILLLLH